jgi:hypothetical protein
MVWLIKGWAWLRAHWLDALLLVTGVTLVAAGVRAYLGTRVPNPITPTPAPPPDDAAPLAPLAAVAAAAAQIEATTRAAAAHEQAAAEANHAAIDAATTVDDVDAVLYGRRHSTLPGASGGPAPAPDGGASAPPGPALPR